ncbi:RNA-binding protein [Propylenella binzhouense]|uniref:RNA-binding protein n=1 Tax=Propylenella binzhouense TaxID=2555902 RepID=A0A964T2U0_9HYPH|nr:RNA-binding protein [Propylenella binzhouense]MYZ47438.1 RNA-binding protein [Propylenella binzhouense]
MTAAEGGAKGPRAGRTRTCIATRTQRPEAELLRFVAGPEGEVVPDLRARLPGRGVWVGAERRLVEEAVRKNLFARALKQPVKAGPELPGLVGELLRKSALGRLGLARKAGEAVTGFAKVEATIESGRAAALVIAADAAEDGRRKMEAALRRRSGSVATIPVIRVFCAEDLSLALGRPHVIHAAVLHGPAGRNFAAAAERIAHYEGCTAGSAADREGDARNDE